VTIGAGVPGGLFYHAPYLDATDPTPSSGTTGRLPAACRALLSSKRAGTPRYERWGGVPFVSHGGSEGNSQSSTSYVFATELCDRCESGSRCSRRTDSPTPRFRARRASRQVWNFQATRGGATIDIKTSSIYAQDSLDGQPAPDAGSRNTPRRLCGPNATRRHHRRRHDDTRAAFGRGRRASTKSARTTIQGSYAPLRGQVRARCSSRRTANVSRPNEVDYVYTGPGGAGEHVLRPGFDLGELPTVVSFASFPTANVQVTKRTPVARCPRRNCGSWPSARTGGMRRQFTSGAKTTNFVEDFVSLSNGVVNVPARRSV